MKKLGVWFLVLAMAMAVFACTKTLNPGKKVAIKALARRAGHLVANANPELKVTIPTSYYLIKGLKEDEFRKAFLENFNAYLEEQGVKGDPELESIALDMLKEYNMTLKDFSKTLAFLQKFQVDDIKEVVEAFIEGMSFSS